VQFEANDSTTEPPLTLRNQPVLLVVSHGISTRRESPSALIRALLGHLQTHNCRATATALATSCQGPAVEEKASCCRCLGPPTFRPRRPWIPVARMVPLRGSRRNRAIPRGVAWEISAGTQRAAFGFSRGRIRTTGCFP